MRISKNIRRIISIVTLLIFIMTLDSFIGNYLKPVTYADYFNHDINMMKKNNQNSDLIFIGASRVYRSYVPKIFEDELELKNVINAGSSAQTICGSYYQLKELTKSFKPKYVVLGVTIDQLMKTEDSNPQKQLIMLDRLSKINKVQYLVSDFNHNNILLGIFRTYRFAQNFSISSVKDIQAQKKNLKSKNYKASPSKPEYYADFGFVYSFKSYKDGNIEYKEPLSFKTDNIDTTNKKYLDKIVKLCKDKNIKLILSEAPTTMMQTYNYKGYQEYNNYYTDYAKKNNLIFHNMNLLKNKDSLFPDSLMHDYNHLNGEGAKKFSKIYSEILKKSFENQNTGQYFYNDINEAKLSINRIVSVKADLKHENDKLFIKISSLHNKNIKPVYKILLTYDGISYHQVVNWNKDDNLSFKLPKVAKGSDSKIMIMAKPTGDSKTPPAFQVYHLK